MSWLVPLDIGVSMGLTLAWSVLALALGLRLFSFPDLTVEGSLTLGAATFAVLVKGGAHPILAALAAMVAGAAAGALTGTIYARLKLNKFLAGILVVAICYTLSLRVMGGSNIGLLRILPFTEILDRLDARLGNPYHLGSILTFGLLLSLGAFTIIMMAATRKGLSIRAAGSNPNYARGLGINVTFSLTLGLACTNALAALSGVLLSVRQGFADVGMGQGVLILALASIALGERLMPGRYFSYHTHVVFAAITGSLVYQIIVACAIRLGLAPTDLKMATAVLVLIVVAARSSRDRDLFSEGALGRI
jgi:putative ABC transport system permease protein